MEMYASMFSINGNYENKTIFLDRLNNCYDLCNIFVMRNENCLGTEDWSGGRIMIFKQNYKQTFI